MNFIKHMIIVLFALLLSTSAFAELTEKTVKSADDVPILYRVQGEGDPALIFVHGWVGNQEFWKAQREFFAQTHKVVTLNLAGHGTAEKDRQDWTIKALSEDLLAVITALELQKAIIIGHAAGASVAIEAARAMPEQIIGIIGIDTLQDIKLSSTIEQQERILARFREDYMGLTTRIIRSMFSPNADPSLVEKTTQEMLSVPEDIGIATLQASMAYSLAPAVQSLSIPIRCINSDAFPTNVQGNKEFAKSYEVLIVPASGHFFFLESPDEFNKILANVLQEMIGFTMNEAEASTAE